MKIAKVRNVKTPERGTSKSAGIDFFIPADFTPVELNPQHDVLIPSGIKARIPEGYMLMAADKSGVVTSANAVRATGKQPKPTAFDSIVTLGAKIVDEDYQGEIHIHLINTGRESVKLVPGMKIAQFILVPVSYDGLEVVDEKDLFAGSTERGDGGFGSTDKAKLPKVEIDEHVAKVLSTPRTSCRSCANWQDNYCNKGYDYEVHNFLEGRCSCCRRYKYCSRHEQVE